MENDVVYEKFTKLTLNLKNDNFIKKLSFLKFVGSSKTYIREIFWRVKVFQ